MGNPEGEGAVILAAGPGRQARSHLALDHQNHHGEPVGPGGEIGDDPRSDLVGKIRDDLHGGGEIEMVHFQGVPLHEFEPGLFQSQIC